MSAKKVKKQKKTHCKDTTPKEKTVIPFANPLQVQLPLSSINDELIEILKKNPNHFLGCGG